MKFITSVYGNDYVPLISVCLHSLLKKHPNDKVTVVWDDISEQEITFLKRQFPNYAFLKQDQNITSTNVYERIPLKLRFWAETCRKMEKGETVCFMDSDMVVLENISNQVSGEFDFIYTYKDEQFPLNVGIVIVNISEKVCDFMELWLQKTEEIVADETRLEYSKTTNGAADQQALFELMNLANIEKGGATSFDFGEILFKGIPCEVLNQTNSVPVNSGAKILHYKGGWREILLREGPFTPNRPEKTSKEMKVFWEKQYFDYNSKLLSDLIIEAAKKNESILPWDKIKYEERGILHSEMLAVIATSKQLGAEVIIESGRARGQSTAILAQAFLNDDVPIISVELTRDEAAEFAEQNLAKYKNIQLQYGDSNTVIPKLVEKYKDKKVVILLDGPKGEDAYRLFANVIKDHYNVVAGFFHDCRKSKGKMINSSRDSIYKYFDRLFFTDNEEYVKNFSYVDEACKGKEGEINMHTWRPFMKGFDEIGSYGPTIGVVIPSERDRVRARKTTLSTALSVSNKSISPNPKFIDYLKRKAKSLVTAIVGKKTASSLKRRLRGEFSTVVETIQPVAVAPIVYSINKNHLATGWTTKEREEILELCLTYLASSHIYGDYAEFGVWRGDTLATAYQFTQHLSGTYPKFSEMKFHALDSFEGFPDLKDGDDFPQFKKGGRFCSIEDFVENMKSKSVDMNRITTTKGWFNKSLLKGAEAEKYMSENSVSLAWVDCDLYESTVDVLEFIKDKLIPGGIVIFDDWFCFAGNPTQGEMRAVKEWLEKYPEIGLIPFRQFHWHGNSFIFYKFDSNETVEDLRRKNLVL